MPLRPTDREPSPAAARAGRGAGALRRRPSAPAEGQRHGRPGAAGRGRARSKPVKAGQTGSAGGSLSLSPASSMVQGMPPTNALKASELKRSDESGGIRRSITGAGRGPVGPAAVEVARGWRRQVRARARPAGRAAAGGRGKSARHEHAGAPLAARPRSRLASAPPAPHPPPPLGDSGILVIAAGGGMRRGGLLARAGAAGTRGRPVVCDASRDAGGCAGGLCKCAWSILHVGYCLLPTKVRLHVTMQGRCCSRATLLPQRCWPAAAGADTILPQRRPPAKTGRVAACFSGACWDHCWPERATACVSWLLRSRGFNELCDRGPCACVSAALPPACCAQLIPHLTSDEPCSAFTRPGLKGW